MSQEISKAVQKQVLEDYFHRVNAKGGYAVAKKRGKKWCSERARKAAKARWSKKEK